MRVGCVALEHPMLLKEDASRRQQYPRPSASACHAFPRTANATLTRRRVQWHDGSRSSYVSPGLVYNQGLFCAPCSVLHAPPDCLKNKAAPSCAACAPWMWASLLCLCARRSGMRRDCMSIYLSLVKADTCGAGLRRMHTYAYSMSYVRSRNVKVKPRKFRS